MPLKATSDARYRFCSRAFGHVLPEVVVESIQGPGIQAKRTQLGQREGDKGDARYKYRSVERGEDSRRGRI